MAICINFLLLNTPHVRSNHKFKFEFKKKDYHTLFFLALNLQLLAPHC